MTPPSRGRTLPEGSNAGNTGADTVGGRRSVGAVFPRSRPQPLGDDLPQPLASTAPTERRLPRIRWMRWTGSAGLRRDRVVDVAIADAILAEAGSVAVAGRRTVRRAAALRTEKRIRVIGFQIDDHATRL